MRPPPAYDFGRLVAPECVFCWYWVADLCAEQSIELVLGHALDIKAMLDAAWISKHQLSLGILLIAITRSVSIPTDGADRR